jgi:sodium-dependent phosphate cotransporter
MKRFSNYAYDRGLTSITSRPFRIHVLLPGLLVAFLLFFFSVRLLGAATDNLSESIPHYHWTVIGNDLSALGAGWLGALVMMNGSVVAALSLSFFHSDLIDHSNLFMMISGSRLGASGIIFIIGILDHLHGRKTTLEDSTSMGVLAFLLTHSIYIPATVLGFLLLPILTTLVLDPKVMGYAAVPAFQIFTPTIDSIVKFSSWLSVPFAILVMFLSLKLFDAIFCCLDGNAIGMRLLSFFDGKWTSFFLGLLMSIITASVALSLGIFVPLYNRNMIKKTALIPYIMGANIGTLADTLLVGIILEDADGVLVVIILAGLALIITIVALVAGNRFIESVEHLQDRIVGDRYLFFEFWAVMLAAPILLILIHFSK